MSTEQKEGMLLPTRKQHSHKKESRVLERRTSASMNTVDTANANVSASTNLPTNTADTSVSMSTAAPTSETSGDKDVKICQPKALNKSRVSSPLISFLFHSSQLSILTTVQEPPSSTLLTTINAPCHLYNVRIETSCNR